MKCYVETSPAGYPLFKKYNFEDVTDMEIDLLKYRNGYGSYRYKHIVMTRPPETPPVVPPKDHDKSERKSGSTNGTSVSYSTSGRRISGKASLIEIKRSPRPEQSTTSKDSESKESDSLTSPQADRSLSSRESDTMTSLTGRFPEPPSKSASQDKLLAPDRVWFSKAMSKSETHLKESTADRVWFSEHH